MFYLYLHQKKSQANRILYLAVFMSIFSNLSLLFFETTEQTQLSMVEIENSFGLMRNYSEPNYVTGVFKSFTELNSYLIIFTTSFVGVVFFKILLLLFDKVSTLDIKPILKFVIILQIDPVKFCKISLK